MAMAANGGPSIKRKGLVDSAGTDIYDKLKDKRLKAHDAAALDKLQKMKDMAKEIAEDQQKGVVADDKPFLGAQPKLLKHPEISTRADSVRASQVACRTLAAKIASSASVHVVFAQDSKFSEATRGILDIASDDVPVEGAPVVVSMANDWLQTLPHVERPNLISSAGKLLIFVGTPGKYLAMNIRSDRGEFDKAYNENRLVILCKGVCMLPLGSQQQNIYGLENEVVLQAVASAIKERGPVAWGHGLGTKPTIMQKAYGYPKGGELPKTLKFGDEKESMVSFDYLTEYIKYLNLVKMAKPSLPVTNYYDTGLTVSVLTGTVVQAGPSLLMDRDALTMLRDASIGHIVSKLNQLVAVEPYSTTKGVYNFFIGDGACRLNGGVELALHLIEGYTAKSMITFFVFNNHKWAIEDNLVADTEKEHHLYNTDFYNLLQQHGKVCVTENDLELRETLEYLSKTTDDYLSGKVEPGLFLVVVRGLDMDLPPVIGDIEPIRKSPEMKFMRDVLGNFASGCQHKVPIYGCSAFEYIQFLHIFMDEMPEGKKYQYVCGRTDIQAAHMCGYTQPEGKCVLFINDVYGVNSLGESLRMVLSGFGGKQLLLMIWHPSLLKVMDHFHLHRPPMVWPSLGQELCKYYVRKESDALFIDFEGGSNAPVVTKQVNSALNSKTPLVCVNMLPEQERDYVGLDIRVKTG